MNFRKAEQLMLDHYFLWLGFTSDPNFKLTDRWINTDNAMRGFEALHLAAVARKGRLSKDSRR